MGDCQELFCVWLGLCLFILYNIVIGDEKNNTRRTARDGLWVRSPFYLIKKRVADATLFSLVETVGIEPMTS